MILHVGNGFARQKNGTSINDAAWGQLPFRAEGRKKTNYDLLSMQDKFYRSAVKERLR